MFENEKMFEKILRSFLNAKETGDAGGSIFIFGGS
jgi:hypothetical protein